MRAALLLQPTILQQQRVIELRRSAIRRRPISRPMWMPIQQQLQAQEAREFAKTH